jgi:hypothetical protein
LLISPLITKQSLAKNILEVLKRRKVKEELENDIWSEEVFEQRRSDLRGDQIDRDNAKIINGHRVNYYNLFCKVIYEGTPTYSHFDSESNSCAQAASPAANVTGLHLAHSCLRITLPPERIRRSG